MLAIKRRRGSITITTTTTTTTTTAITSIISKTNPESTDLMNPDIKQRIFAAADELFSASATGAIPTVEAVRQKSRASMSYVIEALKEWRQRQRQLSQVVRDPLPEVLQEAVLTLGRSVWETAQRVASESLDAARAVFEEEKAELAVLSVEQSEAFESLRTQWETSKAKCIEVEAIAKAVQGEATHLRERLALMTEQAALSEARAVEIEKRANDLKAELARAQAEADQLRADMAGIKSTTESQRDEARKEAGTAREEAARLRGELDAVKAQNISLLRTLRVGGDGVGEKDV